MQVAPGVCSVFKGVLPSDLYERYDREGGRLLMEMDLVVAAEIGERISQQHDESKAKRANAKDAVSRRNQRRQNRGATMDAKSMGQFLKDSMGMDE